MAEQHILILTPGFPKDENDSTCIPALQDYLLSLIEHAPQIKITVVSLQYPEQNTYQWKQIKVHAIGGQNRGGIIRLITWQRALKKVKRINEEHMIDVIHSFWMTEAAYLGQKLSNNLTVPHIITVMGQDALSKKYWRKVFPAKLIALSKFHQQKIEKFQNREAIVVPWGARANDLTNRDKEIDVIGVGSLIEIKNWMDFLAIIELTNKSRSIKCQIVGSGPMEQQLKREIKKRQLPIILIGARDRQETLKIMAHSKVLLHTSRFESYGMVVAEALLHRCNVVSSPVGIASELDSVFKYGNIQEASAQVISALENDFCPDDLEKLNALSTAKSYYQIYRSFIQ